METTCTAFLGHQLLCSGSLASVLHLLQQRMEAGENIVLYDDQTGKRLDVDPREIPPEPPPAPPTGRGRPKLGVVSREISLLPRHWEWLEQQPQGASAALRRLVEEARKNQPDQHQLRRSREAAYRFLTDMAGDFPGYEEALRALYAGDRPRFTAQIAAWPADLQAYVLRISAAAWVDG